jgi:hypothetical protein
VAHLQDTAFLPRQRDEPVRLPERGRDRLLDEDVGSARTRPFAPCAASISAATPSFGSTKPAGSESGSSARMRAWCFPRYPHPTMPVRIFDSLKRAEST